MDWKSLILMAVPILAGFGACGIIIKNSRALLREVADVLDCIDTMLADNNVTKEEMKELKKEMLDVWIAVKGFKVG